MEHTKICGAETDNMNYGAKGLPMTVEEEADFLEKLNNSDNQIMLVAEMDEVIVGTANYLYKKFGFKELATFEGYFEINE